MYFRPWIPRKISRLLNSSRWSIFVEVITLFVLLVMYVMCFMYWSLGAFDFKRRCTEWSVYDIKVPREPFDSIGLICSLIALAILWCICVDTASNTPNDDHVFQSWANKIPSCIAVCPWAVECFCSCVSECHTENEIKARDPIRCRECGYRIMYKKRTKRCILSQLNNTLWLKGTQNCHLLTLILFQTTTHIHML